MGLVPEFFVLLGIDIFLCMSLLSAFLDEDLPSRFQYLFQIAAIVGLGELLIGQGFVELMRFWLSFVYLALALSSVVGLNAYLAVVRRRMDIASTFSGTITVPTLMISAVFISSFLGGGGEVSLSPAAILTLSVLVFVASLSIFGFLREASKHIRNIPGGQGSTAAGPVPTPPGTAETDLSLHLPSMREGDWEKIIDDRSGEE